MIASVLSNTSEASHQLGSEGKGLGDLKRKEDVNCSSWRVRKWVSMGRVAGLSFIQPLYRSHQIQ